MKKHLLLSAVHKSRIINVHLLLEYPLWAKNFIEDVFSHMGVNSTERVIQEVDVTVLIHSPCQTHSLLLSSTQVDALREMSDTISHEATAAGAYLLSNLNHVSSRQNVQVRYKGTSLKCLAISHVV